MAVKSYLFAREPLWREHRKGAHHCLPENVQSWTYEAGSLTQRLRDFYGSEVKVKILFHQWRTPFLGERRLLNLPSYRYCLIREVMLHCQDKPLLLARTAIPAETITAAHRNLAHLGSKPLGEVIFAYPDLERITMELTEVSTSAWTSQAISTGRISGQIYGRRTVYAIHHRPMLVSEFFLPEILSR